MTFRNNKITFKFSLTILVMPHARLSKTQVLGLLTPDPFRNLQTQLYPHSQH